VKRVAVIGGGIGGLCAAGELAVAGHRVTLYEAASTVGGKAQAVSHHGVHLDTGPTLLTLPDTVRDAFRRLGALDLLPRFQRLGLQAHYRYADGRDFLCWEDLDRAAESAEALGPGEGRALKGFAREAERIYRAAGEPYLEAPYEGLPSFMARVLRRGLGPVVTGLSLSTLDALARRHFRTEALRQFVGRFATYTGASPYLASAGFAMIPHLERAFGVHHVEGGMARLVQALATAVARQGVEVRTSARATWRERRGAFVAGPPDGLEAYDSVVVNADPLAELGRAEEPLSTSGYVFHVAVDRRVALPHHLVLFSGDYATEFRQLFAGAVPDEPTIYVCHPAASDASMAPAGQSGLFVMVNVPAFRDQATAEAAWPGYARGLQAFCLARLRAAFPELASATLTVFADRTPVDLARTGAPGGSIYGYLPHGRFGPFRRPELAGRVRGLFYAGGGTHPGGGVPLVMLSGRFAAGLALRHLGGQG
jgi:phytoene desaturase